MQCDHKKCNLGLKGKYCQAKHNNLDIEQPHTLKRIIQYYSNTQTHTRTHARTHTHQICSL